MTISVLWFELRLGKMDSKSNITKAKFKVYGQGIEEKENELRSRRKVKIRCSGMTSISCPACGTWIILNAVRIVKLLTHCFNSWNYIQSIWFDDDKRAEMPQNPLREHCIILYSPVLYLIWSKISENKLDCKLVCQQSNESPRRPRCVN